MKKKRLAQITLNIMDLGNGDVDVMQKISKLEVCHVKQCRQHSEISYLHALTDHILYSTGENQCIRRYGWCGSKAQGFIHFEEGKQPRKRSPDHASKGNWMWMRNLLSVAYKNMD